MSHPNNSNIARQREANRRRGKAMVRVANEVREIFSDAPSDFLDDLTIIEQEGRRLATAQVLDARALTNRPRKVTCSVVDCAHEEEVYGDDVPVDWGFSADHMYFVRPFHMREAQVAR